MYKEDICQYCGSKNMVIGYQKGHAMLTRGLLFLSGSNLMYIVCKDCGTVVRVVAERPDRLKDS